ncbi:MAG: PKD domain-containing protein, partial [Bacteroidota bacterium]
TEVYVNGEANPIAVLNAGEYFPIPTVNYGANRGNMYVQTSNPAYMYQMLSSTDVNINLSLNFVPPINCFQPREVNNIASTDQIGNTIFSGGVILVTTTDAVLEVTDGNGVVNLPAATPVPGNAIFSTYRIDGLVGNVSVVSDGALQVGVFGQSGAIGWAGYYAGFPTENPFLTSLSLGGGGDVCRDGSYLFVLGSEYDRYLWYRDGEFLVEEPTGSLFTGPYGGGEYTVQGVLDGCGQTSLSTAFEFECPDAFSCASTSAALWLSPESIVLSPANQLTGWGDISGNSFLQENPFALRNPGIFWAADGVENFYRTIALRENNFLESIPLNSSLLRRQGEISMFAVFNANNDGLVFSNGNPTNTQTGLSASRAFVGDNGTPLVFDTPVGQELSLVSTVRTGALAEAFLNGMANGNAAPQVEEWIDAELTVGAQLSDANVPELLLDGNLAELIIFPTALDQAQREQVQSHLGIKYGFSLPHDLYSSAGDVLRTAGDPYANEVAAIAQDECANLDHKQSANRAPTALLTMGLGGIFPLNRVNPNDFPTDMSYLMWGHDNQALDITRPITGNDSVSCVAMARTWHVTEPLNPVPQVTLSIPDNLGVSFLITSPDEDFENGNETYYRLVDEGAGALTLEIDFPASQYITFGTETNSLTLSSDTTVCLGSSVMLEAAGATSYLWTSNSLNNIINAATPTPEVTVNETAFIYVQAQDDNGCILQDSVLINSFSSDAVNAGPDQSVCLGDSISLTATGAESYIWINIGRSTLPDQTVSPTTTTLYVVEGRDDNACVSYDSVEVSVAFIPEIQLADTVEACIGGEVSITASANTSLPLVWSTGEEGNTISFTAQTAQPFQVVATSELGCVASATTFLQITEGPIAAFTADNEEDIEALAVAFTNLSQNATKYVWQFGDRTTSGQENPTHTYELVGEYEATLIALDDFGCSDTASLGPLRVNDIRIFAPSAFSPNGDGENDEYFVVTQGISDMSMKVFNRWGRQITEIEGVEVRWDGTAEGAIVPEGVYVGKISGVSSKKGKVLETTTIITIVR